MSKAARASIFGPFTDHYSKSNEMITSRSLASLGSKTTLGCRHSILHNIPRTFHAPRHARVRHTSSPVQASLWSFSDDIVNALHTGTTIAIVLGLGLSGLPLFTGDSKERNEKRFLQPNEEEGDDNIRWGVMSALAFLPFLNPMVGQYQNFILILLCIVQIYA